jgi:hypothetical protein
MLTTSHETTHRAAYEVVSAITLYGERINEAIANMQSMIDNVTTVLADEHDVTRGAWTFNHVDDPARLLNDMRPLCELARTLGAPDVAIAEARRGQFVPMSEYIDMSEPV